MWFVGAPLSLAADDDGLVPPDAEVVAVRPGDRHLTLVFLGHLPDDAALGYWRSLSPLRLPAEVRALRWQRLGRSALALELSDEDGLLATAARRCHDAADGVVAVPRHAEYRPHLTLARVPRRARPPSRGVLGEWPLPSSPLAVGAPTLFRSRPHAPGDRYEIVDQHPTG